MRIDVKNLQGLAVAVLALASFSAYATQTSYFIYDEAGHVIGEYDANGNPIQEHIYLGDRPVAVVQNNTTMSYVTTDQLNTPRVVTDSNRNVVWQWNSDPFGNGQPTGSLTYNLRFPGQYFDAETGHNYNYNRDYDPGTGRYVESDPKGLKGGINTYIYGNANPIRYTDMFGLTWLGTNWCGPGGGGLTTGCIDAACKMHDQCYDACNLRAGNRWLPSSIYKVCPLLCDLALLHNVKQCVGPQCENHRSIFPDLNPDF